MHWVRHKAALLAHLAVGFLSRLHDRTSTRARAREQTGAPGVGGRCRGCSLKESRALHSQAARAAVPLEWTASGASEWAGHSRWRLSSTSSVGRQSTASCSCMGI